MRLLAVTHFYEAHGGGIERVAARLCRELARAGHEIAWAASAADALPDDIATVPLRCVDPAERLTGLPMPLPGPHAVAALARAVRASDAVIVHDALYVTSILALLLAKAHGKPCVLIQHIAGIAFASPALRALMRVANLVVTRPMLASADHLVFIGDTVRRELIGEPARRDHRLLFNGVDTAIFYPAATGSGHLASAEPSISPPPCGERLGVGVPAAPSMSPDDKHPAAGRTPTPDPSPQGGGEGEGSMEFKRLATFNAAQGDGAPRAAFGLPPDGTLAVFVGRFVEKKGLAVLRALAARRPALHLALVGAGPIRPERWGLANVHVLGPLPQARVAALYRVADLLLLPSVGEGYPLVVQEAMASGLPVVCGADSARADPQASAYLRGVTIDLADPEGSAQRCAAAVDGLAADPVDRAGMAACAAARYSWPAMAAGIVACLSGV